MINSQLLLPFQNKICRFYSSKDGNLTEVLPSNFVAFEEKTKKAFEKTRNFRKLWDEYRGHTEKNIRGFDDSYEEARESAQIVFDMYKNIENSLNLEEKEAFKTKFRQTMLNLQTELDAFFNSLYYQRYEKYKDPIDPIDAFFSHGKKPSTLK